jgi:hypothetical protein
MKNNWLTQLLKTEFVEYFTKKLILKLGWSMSGFQGWLAKLIVENAYEYVAKPVAMLLIRKGYLIYDKATGTFRLKKIKKAKEDGDAETFWDTISNI